MDITTIAQESLEATTTEGPPLEDDSYNYAKSAFLLIVMILGVVGNLISIFVIVLLKEYRKSVVNMYVLQLAIADVAFLLTIPFKIDEDIHKRWTFADWMCTAKETILYLNYNASILFLIVMSIDRYIAVCHTFSDKLSKLRETRSAVIIICVVWTLALLFCIPVMNNTHKNGIEPTCTCRFTFPKPPKDRCSETYHPEDEKEYHDQCLKDLQQTAAEGQQYCTSISDLASEFGDETNSTAEPEHYADFYVYIDYDTISNYSTDKSLQETNITKESQTTIMERMKEAIARSCHYHGSPDAWYNFIYSNFVFLYLLPIIVMSISYGLIVRKVISSKMRSGSRSTTRDNQTVSIRNRVTIMSALLVSSFTLCWLPFHAVHLAKIKGIILPEDKGYICENLAIFGSIFAYLNSLLNPIFYSFFGTNFRRRFSSARKSAGRSLRLSSTGERGGRKRSYRNESSNDGTKATMIPRKSKHTIGNSQSQVTTHV